MTREEALVQLRIGPGINEDVSEEYNEAVDMAIKALEAQPSEDCIRRSDATLTNLEILMCNGDYKEALKILLDKIEKAPSVTPQPKEEPQQKTGHWEWVQYESKPNFGNWHCSECHCILCGAINGNPIRLPKYCPECGSYNGGDK